MQYGALKISTVWYGLFSAIVFLGNGQVAIASTSQSPPLKPPNPTSTLIAADFDYWNEAYKLVQAQQRLLFRVQESVNGADPNRARATKGQITLHQFQVDRFKRQQQVATPTACQQGLTQANTTTTASPATQIYCELVANANRLQLLIPVLERRVIDLATVAEVKDPLPLVSGERGVNRAGIPVTRYPDLGKPATPLYAPAPDLEAPEPPLVGRSEKDAIANYAEPVPPALTPPPDAVGTIAALDQSLERIQAIFPNSYQFDDPQANAEFLAQAPYTLYPQEPQNHELTLSLPNTGIVRVLKAESYYPKADVLRNRLQPTVEEAFPFAPLVTPTSEPLPQLRPDLVGRLAPPLSQRFPFLPFPEETFTPRLAIQIRDRQIEIHEDGIDYGFMTPLGDIPLEDVTFDLEQYASLPEDVREFYYTYEPPQQLMALQADRRRFLTGKFGNLPLDRPLYAQLPAELNQTYLLRLVQFQLPEAIAERKLLRERDRRYLDVLLETPSSDLLIAFRPVSERSDGTYVVLWRVLGKFPEPKIQDLDQYVQFQ